MSKARNHAYNCACVSDPSQIRNNKAPPAQFCRQCEHNCRVGKALSKPDNVAQVAGVKATPKFMRQLLAQLVQQSGAVIGPPIAQYFRAQPLSHSPVQPCQLSIHRTCQALAAAGNQ